MKKYIAIGHWDFSKNITCTAGDAKTMKDSSCSRIKATVKDHTVRDGVKQTVITRCKVA